MAMIPHRERRKPAAGIVKRLLGEHLEATADQNLVRRGHSPPPLHQERCRKSGSNGLANA